MMAMSGNVTNGPEIITCDNATNDLICAELEWQYKFESIVRIVVPVVFGLIALVGLVGNLLVVLLVAVGGHSMHSTTNVFIINLALADLAFIIVCVPFTAAGYSLTIWPFGDVWCKVSIHSSNKSKFN